MKSYVQSDNEQRNKTTNVAANTWDDDHKGVENTQLKGE